MSLISLKEVVHKLPAELWWVIFDTMSIEDRLEASQVVAEFEEFYAILRRDLPKYFSLFTNIYVESFSRRSLRTLQPYVWQKLSHLPKVTFCIFRCKRWVSNFTEVQDAQNLQLVQFETDATSVQEAEYGTYLKINALCWLRFAVYSLKVPTGSYHIFFRVRGPTVFVENMFKITLKHKDTKIPHDFGYVNSGDLDDLSVLWQWVPVYADTAATELLSIYLNFEQGDWCSQLSLSSMNDRWIRDLSFSNIQFSCIHNLT